jgi:hypothetical protein
MTCVHDAGHLRMPQNGGPEPQQRAQHRKRVQGVLKVDTVLIAC